MRQHLSRAAIDSRNHSTGTELVSGRTVIDVALIEETYKATLRASDDYIGGHLGLLNRRSKTGHGLGAILFAPSYAGLRNTIRRSDARSR